MGGIADTLQSHRAVSPASLERFAHLHWRSGYRARHSAAGLGKTRPPLTCSRTSTCLVGRYTKGSPRNVGSGPPSSGVTSRQKTISREVTLAGHGLFSGEAATLTFSPAGADAGVTFVREQDGKVATIPALIDIVIKQPRRTCLKNGTLLVQTVEHCMAALLGMGIDNVIVKVAGGAVGEVP